MGVPYSSTTKRKNNLVGSIFVKNYTNWNTNWNTNTNWLNFYCDHVYQYSRASRLILKDKKWSKIGSKDVTGDRSWKTLYFHPKKGFTLPLRVNLTSNH